MTGPALLESIAASLRAARERSELTLEELASRAGLSKAHLSRLESGERQPSVAALLTLARTLGVPVSQLLGEAADDGALAVFAGERPTRSTNGLTMTPCSGYRGSRLLEAVRIRVEPDREPPMPARHRGEEWLYVLSGTLLFEVGADTHVLGPGECVHFDAGQPHRLGARGGAVELLMVAVDVPNDLRRIHR